MQITKDPFGRAELRSGRLLITRLALEDTVLSIVYRLLFRLGPWRVFWDRLG